MQWGRNTLVRQHPLLDLEMYITDMGRTTTSCNRYDLVHGYILCRAIMLRI